MNKESTKYFIAGFAVASLTFGGLLFKKISIEDDKHYKIPKRIYIEKLKNHKQFLYFEKGRVGDLVKKYEAKCGKLITNDVERIQELFDILLGRFSKTEEVLGKDNKSGSFEFELILRNISETNELIKRSQKVSKLLEKCN
jgi:hypothetical protein